MVDHHVYLFKQYRDLSCPWLVQWETNGWDDEGKRADSLRHVSFESWVDAVGFLRGNGW